VNPLEANLTGPSRDQDLAKNPQQPKKRRWHRINNAEDAGAADQRPTSYFISSQDEAERRAWATVNKVHHGGEKPGGGGYGKPENHEPMRKGGRKAH
jgi:hypothetical protein